MIHNNEEKKTDKKMGRCVLIFNTVPPLHCKKNKKNNIKDWIACWGKPGKKHIKHKGTMVTLFKSQMVKCYKIKNTSVFKSFHNDVTGLCCILHCLEVKMEMVHISWKPWQSSGLSQWLVLSLSVLTEGVILRSHQLLSRTHPQRRYRLRRHASVR